MNVLMKWTLLFAAFMLVMKPGHSYTERNGIKPVRELPATCLAQSDFCNE